MAALTTEPLLILVYGAWILIASFTLATGYIRVRSCLRRRTKLNRSKWETSQVKPLTTNDLASSWLSDELEYRLQCKVQEQANKVKEEFTQPKARLQLCKKEIGEQTLISPTCDIPIRDLDEFYSAITRI